MWIICEFIGEDNEVAAVPEKWLNNEKTICFWPRCRSDVVLQKKIAKEEDPGSNWLTYDIKKILSTASSYEEARKKLKISEHTSELEEEYEKLNNKDLRKERHKMNLASSEEDSTKIKTSIPEIPQENPFDSVDNTFPNESKIVKSAVIPKDNIRSQWHVVEFDSDHSIRIVLDSWLCNDNECSYWPPYKNNDLVTTSLKSLEEAKDNWDKFQVYKMFSSYDTYTDAVLGKIHYENLQQNDAPEKTFSDEKEIAKSAAPKSDTRIQYFIVRFVTDNSIRIVLDSWLDINNKWSYWPPYENNDVIIASLTSLEKPADDWDEFQISEVLSNHDSYANAVLRKVRLQNLWQKNSVEKQSFNGKDILEPKSPYEGTTTPKDNLENVRQEDSFVNTFSDENLELSSTSIDSRKCNTKTYWSIVKFTDNSIEIILDSWMDINNKTCYWPPYDSKSIINSLMKKEKPGKGWNVLQISEIFSTCDSYIAAIEMKEQCIKNGHKEQIKITSSRSINGPKPHSSSKLMTSNENKRKSLTLQEIQNLDTDGKLLCIYETCREVISNQANANLMNMQSSEPRMCNFVEMRALLPINEVDKFHRFNQDLIEKQEVFAKVNNYLESIGGPNAHETVRRMLSAVMTDELASQFNFCGQRGDKYAFKDLKILIMISDIAVGRFLSKYTSNDCEASVKSWLKEAPRRVQNKEQRKKKINKRNTNANSKTIITKNGRKRNHIPSDGSDED